MARKAAASTTASDLVLDGSVRILVLYGAEEMLKRQHLDTLRSALRKEHGDLDTVIYDGQTAALAQVLDELRTYSLLQSYKIVLVDAADEFVKRHREAMERYAQSPVDQATLVLRSTTWNKGNLDKAIAKVGGLVKCDPLPINQVPAWLTQRAKAFHDQTIDPQAAQLLAQRLGSDLLRLDSELAKLSVLAGQGQPIGLELVQQMVGKSSDEEAWAVQEAILQAIQGGKRLTAAGGTPAGEILVKLHEIVDLAGQEEVRVNWAVTDLMRKLAQGVMLRQKGIPEMQIARQVGLWGPGVAPFMAVLRRVRTDQAARWFDRAMDVEFRARRGLGDSLRNLECFCVTLADEV